MNIALHKPQMLTLLVLAFFTIIVVTFVMLSAVAHTNMWHWFLSSAPAILFPYRLESVIILR